MYTVYWIKYPDYTDPYTEGYIGITSQSLEDRFKNHKDNRKNQHLRNRCRTENVTIVPICEGLDEDSARKLESQYRPSENIGWNIAKGGDIPPSRRGKASPKSLLRGDDRTEAQKKAAKSHAENMKGRKSPKKGKTYSSPKICAACQQEFFRNENRAKFCSRKCAGTTNSSPEKRVVLAEKRRLFWMKRRLNV